MAIATRGPRLARSHSERLNNTDLAGVQSIVWSPDEFYRALEVYKKAVVMSPEEQDRWRRDLLGGDPSEFVFGDMPFLSLYVGKWFDKRYRAHAPRVGTYHSVRMEAAVRFLLSSEASLLADGWASRDARGTGWDEDLIRAVSSIHFTMEPLLERGEQLDFAYADVAALAAQFRAGGLKVDFFKPRRYRGPGSEVYEVEYESTNDRMPLRLLADGVKELCSIENLSEAARAEVEAQMRERLPAFSAAGMDVEQVMLTAWVASQPGVTQELVLPYATRIASTAAFLKGHEERLIADGYLIDADDGRDLDVRLLQALNWLAIEVPRGSEKLPVPDYDRVIRAIGMWDQVRAVRPSGPVGGGSRQLKLGRNDPCPCGSGRKYKWCCGAN